MIVGDNKVGLDILKKVTISIGSEPGVMECCIWSTSSWVKLSPIVVR